MELFALETSPGASVALVSATTMILCSTLAALTLTLLWITRKNDSKSVAVVQSAVDLIFGRPKKSEDKFEKASSSDPKPARARTPPGPQGWPVIGSLHLLASHEVPFEAFSHLSRVYGDIFSITLGTTPCVVVNSFPLIKEVLITKGPHFGGRPNFIRYDILFGGDRDNCEYLDSSQYFHYYVIEPLVKSIVRWKYVKRSSLMVNKKTSSTTCREFKVLWSLTVCEMEPNTGTGFSISFIGRLFPGPSLTLIFTLHARSARCPVGVQTPAARVHALHRI